ncbi:MAG: SpoIIE family protein phosphatase, partial [Mycobacterium sp.]|nr:SpoIIE family protein phosphatase [Mycobacterium sp.]
PDAVAPGEGTRASSGVADPYVQEALRWLPGDTGPATTEHTGSAQAPDSALTSFGSAPRVLIADDSADLREYLTRILGTAGYRVDAVTDGQQALEAIRADRPDLVVSDVMMPRLDGLALIAALRSDPLTAAVPVLLLSARAGQEASIEGLHAGADDYLVKPFAAADLLARARANIELARLRSHHARWRTALVDSMQEAFFVCDEHGTVIEVNSAFTDILGYGPEGMPYEPPHPWWPDAETDPEAHRQVAAAFAGLLHQTHGTNTVPVTHRDGHRRWITFSFNYADDPDSGRRVMVGTFRDVTAEHYIAQRQTALAELNQQLAQADTVDEALQAAAEELRRLWQARRILAVTFPTDGVSPATTSGEPDLLCVGQPSQWADLPPRRRQMISSVRDGDLLTVDTKEPATAGIAVQHPRGVLVICVELAEQRPFTPEDQILLTMLAGRLGQGLQRVHQLDQQRETALALQHAILGPAELPSGFAVRYQPATSPLQVGGDWYDVFALEDGRIGLIVGDCVGHGLAAATVMGQLRSGCRALLLENPSPGAALAGLDRFAARLPGAQCTTAFCAVLDPDSGELVYSRAGHPPPILVHADRRTEMLDEGRALPLGVRPDWSRSEARVTMPPRATLLLYTDGLVERRREALDQGIACAADVVQDGRDAALDDLASQIMSRLAPSGGYQDDVAMLLYRQPAPLEVDIPADVSYLARARTALRSWLARAGVDPDLKLNVLIAAGEAVSNAIEHGHRDSHEGTISLRATTMVDEVRLTVTDTGSWKPPQPAGESCRGRGFNLMRALMHDVTIQPADSGTTVRLHARIT